MTHAHVLGAQEAARRAAEEAAAAQAAAERAEAEKARQLALARVPSLADVVDEATAMQQKQAEAAMLAGGAAVVDVTFDAPERAALVRATNAVLAEDEHLGGSGLLPFDDEVDRELLAAVPDGILLAKLVQAVEDDALDVRALNLGGAGAGGELDEHMRLQNHTLTANSATAIGCGIADLQPWQLLHAQDHAQVVFQFVWNLTRARLARAASPYIHPELFRLLLPSEEIASLTKLTPEQVCATSP